MINLKSYQFSVDDTKISNYLLDFQHPRGKSKGKWLISKGFDFKSLSEALIIHGRSSDVIKTEETDFGTFVAIEGILMKGNLPVGNFRSFWEINQLEKNCRFVTGYPIQL